MAYTAFTKGFMSKFTYFMRTIEGFDQFISPVDDMLNDKFIPTLFGSNSLSAEIREALELKTSDGGSVPLISFDHFTSRGSHNWPKRYHCWNRMQMVVNSRIY